MNFLKRAVAACAIIGLATGAALASPAGVWELDTRDTRFQIELCGDGTELCGKLVWLSDADYNDQYLPFLNAPVAKQIRMSGPNRWKGDMQLFGQDITGTITQVSEDQMTLKGCKFFIACKTYQMFRIEK